MSSPDHAGAPAARTIADTCRYLALGRTGVYQAIARGQLHAIKAGRRTLVTTASIEAFLASLPTAKFHATKSAA